MHLRTWTLTHSSTATIPKQEMLPDSKSLSNYGITSPCLLVVEPTDVSFFCEKQWAAEYVSIVYSISVYA